MLESAIEKEFKKHVDKHGCLYLKFSILGMAGFPDRIIIGSNRLIFFVELKKPGLKNKKRRGEKLQQHRHTTLRKFGFNVYLIDSLKEAKGVFDAEFNRV